MPTPEATRDRKLAILIIENDPADARLTVEAFKEIGLSDSIRCVSDGEEAFAILLNEGRHAATPKPHVIFLDLNLPRKPGLEVLQEIKANPLLKVIPVVVVSGSNDPKAVREAYELHASCFIYKPSDLHQFLHFIKTCYEFWGTVVTLPLVDK